MANRTSKQTLGTPYQIYSEIANAGKNLASTKRRVTWRFGWSEGDSDHEITLVHSVVSGKKTIFEDGREVVTSSGLMSKDFTHGWNSSNYIFRVEVDGRLEHAYTFSIDGVAFVQMPRKQDAEIQRRNEPDHHDRDTRDVERRTPSAISAPNKNKAPFAKSAPPVQPAAGTRLVAADRRFSNDNSEPVDLHRGSFQSPDISKRDNTFDPFDSSEVADPFGDDPFCDDVAAKVNKPVVHNVAPAPYRPPVSLLDDDDVPQSQSSFSPFGTSTAPAAFDPFGTSADPFAPAPSGRKASDFSNDFAGLSFTVAARPVAQEPVSHNTPQTADDFFDEEPLPPAPIKEISSSPEVWSAPKNLVNLDFNAPPAANTNNAFSGRSPSLNLLLNGSSTRPLGATGMNAPPMASMNNGPQGMNNGPQGMNNGPQGMNNGPQSMNNGPMGMNNGPMGMNSGPMGGRGPVMGMGMNAGPSQGLGMMQQPQQQQSFGGQQMMQQSHQSQGGMGMQQQGMGMGMQQQGMGMGMGMQSQGSGMQQRPLQQQPGIQPLGIAGGMGSSNSRLMMGNNSGGQSQGQGQGQFSMASSVNIPSTSGSTSSLIGTAVARGVPSQNVPKSSLDSINWKM